MIASEIINSSPWLVILLNIFIQYFSAVIAFFSSKTVIGHNCHVEYFCCCFFSMVPFVLPYPLVRIVRNLIIKILRYFRYVFWISYKNTMSLFASTMLADSSSFRHAYVHI